MDRLTVSLRLKAARHLAGRMSDKRKEAIPLPVADLAAHPLLVENGISRNRLEEIEQMRVDARPMELDQIALALNVPGWFRPPEAAADVPRLPALDPARAGEARPPSAEAQ